MTTPLTFSKPILDRLHEELQVAIKKNNVSLYRIIQALIWLLKANQSIGLPNC
jgi:hypothetical protein